METKYKEFSYFLLPCIYIIVYLSYDNKFICFIIYEYFSTKSTHDTPNCTV